MKKLFFYLMLVSIGISSYAQKSNETPYLTKSLANEAISNVEVKTSGGSISIEGGSAAEARVEVYVNANNNGRQISPEEIKQRLEENYDLTVSVSNNKVVAIAKQKDRNINWKKSVSISFKVFAPKNINSDLATSGGSISLRDLSGSHSFKTSGGSLHVDNVKGEMDGRTSGGSIHVENSSDNIKLTTSGGSIHASNCSGNLRLSTSGGSIDLSSLKGDIEANTSGGSINGNDIEGELSTGTSGGSVRLNDMACTLEASTSAGSIDVSMKELGKYIKLNNSGGNIDLTIPASKGVDLRLSGNKVSFPALKNFSGKMEDDEVDGKLGGGGIPVTVKAGSGKVYLSVR